MYHHRVISRAITCVVIAISLALLCPEAWAGFPTREVTLNGGTADFGSGSHSLGGPTGNGRVEFDFATVNGQLVAKVRVIGTLYWDSLEAGCARLTIEFRRDARASVNRAINVCGPGGNANLATNKQPVDESISDENLRSVILTTREVQRFSLVKGASSPLINVPTSRSDDNVKVNNGSADFGAGNHSFGGPSAGGRVFLGNDNGIVTGQVAGTLYYDALIGSGCARMIIEFQTAGGSTLRKDVVEECGPGGNANDGPNKSGVLRSFASGSLSRIHLLVGPSASGGNIVNGKSITFTFEP